MLTIEHDDFGNSDTYKVNSVKCENVDNDPERINITVNTPDGELDFYVWSDDNTKAIDVASRIASAVDKPITISIYEERFYIFAIDDSLPDTDSKKQYKISGYKGHYIKPID